MWNALLNNAQMAQNIINRSSTFIPPEIRSPFIITRRMPATVVEELLHRSDPGAGVAVVLETRFAATAALPFAGQLLVVPHPASL